MYNKTQKTMKSKLIQRLTVFLDRRSHNWQQRMCLITFLMLSLSEVLGVPMHIIGMIGRCDTALYTISAMSWAAILVILVMYLTQRMRLTVAISSFGILTQLAESARIVYVAMERPAGFEETIVFNMVISLALIIYMVMAAVRHMPTILALMSIATITSAYLYTDGDINRQIVVIFVIVEIFTCILGEMIRRGIRSMQRENADYHSTISQLLAPFNMTKTELLAYLQMGRGGMDSKSINEFFNHLDNRTEANLIWSVEQRIAHRHMQRADIATVLPTLTPTEQEVCRLIIGGKSIVEIADIMNKNTNNISTVRIHIRKKLKLTKGEDLRQALLKATK